MEAGYIVSALCSPPVRPLPVLPLKAHTYFVPILCDASVCLSPQCDAESDLDERVSWAIIRWVGSGTACKRDCRLQAPVCSRQSLLLSRKYELVEPGLDWEGG